MGLPVFFPTAQISKALPKGEVVTLEELCRRAGVTCRVSGLSSQRHMRLSPAPQMCAVRKPGALGDVWLGIPDKKNERRRALLALGLLAYGIFDYGARETLRGLECAQAVVGPGRPRSKRPQSAAERQRKHRTSQRRQS